MPIYEYECDHCGPFEVEQKITDEPLTSCPRPNPRSLHNRCLSFNEAGGATSWNHRPFSEHPDRCTCQGDDPTPHRHEPKDSGGQPCARCHCAAYNPAEPGLCGGKVTRLIAGTTSFVLKGTGWFKDGY